MTLRDQSNAERRPLGFSIETRAANFFTTGPGVRVVDFGWVWLQLSDRNGSIVHNVLVREEEVPEEVGVAIKRYTMWEAELVSAANDA
jgi:hypothetical protein